MASYNKVILMGNLTRDPELKRTSTDMAVAQIGIAVNRKYKDREGNQKEETTFVDCEAWGKTAETMAKYLSKGKPVFLEGRLKLDQWQDKDGNNRSKLKLVIENFQFIDSRGNQSAEPPPAAATAATTPTDELDPAAVTVATLVSDEAQVTVAPVMAVPRESLTVASRIWVWPNDAKDKLLWFRVTDAAV